MTKLKRTKFLTYIPFLAIVALFFSGCTAPDGNPVDGKRWYNMHNCWSCHGPNGDDGKALPLRGTGISYRGFQAKVRNADSPIMPKFPESKISKQDVADIYAWLNRE
jgi:mono/diheme cytochrome c family protein